MKPSNFHFYDLCSIQTNIYQEVLNGLIQPKKFLPSKLLYDKKGSELFDAICQLPEYYLTRAENEILSTRAEHIAVKIGNKSLLIELGSGSCQKIRLLLPALALEAYIPIDISKKYLLQTATLLANHFPTLSVHAVCLDYTKTITLPFNPSPHYKKVVFFAGSSIGNFEPQETLQFLKMIKTLVSPHGGLLIGVDLHKSNKILTAAYNDRQGLTAAFNLNLLTRINNELNANFLPHLFQHQAFYNTRHHRIEMHLISMTTQSVPIKQHRFDFNAMESILTEKSYKYCIEEFRNLGFQAGFKKHDFWLDQDELFSLHYFEL